MQIVSSRPEMSVVDVVCKGMDSVMQLIEESGLGLGEAARAVFACETGLKPMENPQRDKVFLDRLDLVSPFPSHVLEEAFYDSI